MKRRILFILFSIILFHNSIMSQPSPFAGIILFNLAEPESPWTAITPIEFETKNIQLLSYSKKSVFKYDTINKAFSFNTTGFEEKFFAIVYKTDTMYIDYPSVKHEKSIFIKNPIPLSKKSYSFFDWKIYDAMYNNFKYNKIDIFYICQVCLSSPIYEMTEERKKELKRFSFRYTISLER